MNAYPNHVYLPEYSLSQLEQSRRAAEAYALDQALAQAARRHERRHPVALRRLRRAAARGLVRTARAVDVA